MIIKNLFFQEESKPKTPKDVTYADLLGLSRDFKFTLTKGQVTDQADFDSVVAAAEKTVECDLERLGMDFEKIPPAFKNKIIGEVGSITILGDDDGKLSIKFHLRDENRYWDGKTKKHPEKDTTAKYKAEIFFAVEDEEED